jgi:hypothetical protein
MVVVLARRLRGFRPASTICRSDHPVDAIRLFANAARPGRKTSVIRDGTALSPERACPQYGKSLAGANGRGSHLLLCTALSVQGKQSDGRMRIR